MYTDEGVCIHFVSHIMIKTFKCHAERRYKNTLGLISRIRTSSKKIALTDAGHQIINLKPRRSVNCGYFACSLLSSPFCTDWRDKVILIPRRS